MGVPVLRPLQVTYYRFGRDLLVGTTFRSSANNMYVEAGRSMLDSVGGPLAVRLEATRYYMFDLFVFGRMCFSRPGTLLLGLGLGLFGQLPLRGLMVLTLIVWVFFLADFRFCLFE